jgi:hypothetical protein
MSLGSCDTHHVGCNMGPGADIPTVSGPGRQRRRRVSTVREHWQCAPTAISAKPLRCASRGPFRHPKLLGALTIWFTDGRWTANMRSRGGTADIVRPARSSRCGASRPVSAESAEDTLPDPVTGPSYTSSPRRRARSARSGLPAHARGRRNHARGRRNYASGP